MPLVINSLRSGHTDICTETILRNQACPGHRLVTAWYKNDPAAFSNLHVRTYIGRNMHAAVYTYIPSYMPYGLAHSLMYIENLPTNNHFICLPIKFLGLCLVKQVRNYLASFMLCVSIH